MKTFLVLGALVAGAVVVASHNDESNRTSNVAQAGESWEQFIDRHRVQSVGDPASESYDREAHLAYSRSVTPVDPYTNLRPPVGGISGNLAELHKMTNDAYEKWIQTGTNEAYQKYTSVKAAYESAQRQGMVNPQYNERQ
jgi:hypothetical protein